MSFDYSEVAQLAAELLAEYGAKGSLKTSVTGVRDPDTGIIPVTVTTKDVMATVFAYPEKLVNGKTILQGDEMAYLSSVGLTMPKAGDVLLWSGSDYTVISVKNLAPAGVSVLVETQVRK